MSGSLATNLDSNGNGLTALDYRKILQGFYPNPGIVKGGTVTGNSSLTYHVSPTVAVIDRGSDGTRLVYFEGGDTPAVAAGDAANRRIDTVWLKADDPALDSGSIAVHVGVTSGTPSANPVAPKLDSGQLGLMDKLVQAGATNLSTGSGDNRSYNYTIPYGASLGLLASSYNSDLSTIPLAYNGIVRNAISFTLPTDRIVELVFQCRMTGGVDSSSSMYFSVEDNGVFIDPESGKSGQLEFRTYGIAELKTYSNVFTLTKGMHNIKVNVRGYHSSFRFFGFGSRLFAWDRGVAK